MAWSLLLLLAASSVAGAQGQPAQTTAGYAASYSQTSTATPHTGYWASGGLDFLAARAVHPYLRVDGGLPIIHGISLEVSVLLAEGVRDFYDWSRPGYDWTAAAVTPGILIEKTLHEWDGHYLTLEGDTVFGVHVLQSNRADTGRTTSFGALGRASAGLRLVTSTGLMLHVAPLGVAVLRESEQVHFWYEGALLVGFRWP